MRLAGVSALLTFVILFTFALVVGSLTVHRIRSDFTQQVEKNSAQVAGQLEFLLSRQTGQLKIAPPLHELAPRGQSVEIRVLSLTGGATLAQSPAHTPPLGPPSFEARSRRSLPVQSHGYLTVSHFAEVRWQGGIESGQRAGVVIVQYGRRLSDLNATIARVELLLVLGVLAGSGLALFAGMVIARRAMSPIAELTSTAAEIARTRDPSRTLPAAEAQDEIGELSRTLQSMLQELDSAHAETEAMLERQRRFVADASHELRTPLTSVLANLELLAESLQGEEADAARSALRSSQRMRRLVADLLLLARADVGRVAKRERVDLAQVAIEAAAELGPMSATHEISLDVKPATVEASRDEMLRLTINLIENAVRHTPPGTSIRVSTGARAARTGSTGADSPRAASTGTIARLVVEDDGPGVPAHLRSSLFERFVRGAGDRGGSFGLGLAIVKAVADTHGGSVRVLDTHAGPPPHGARFVVELPASSRAADEQVRQGRSERGVLST